MPIHPQWRERFRRVRSVLPLVIEIALIVTSARVAGLLCANQGYFEAHAPFFDFLQEHWISQEWVWGLLAALAAVLKAGGLWLTLTKSQLDDDAAFLLRLFGWSLSVILWGSFAFSINVADFWSLASILSSLAFGLSVAGLSMGPILPDEINARR